jgi:BirA family transcriptional regulator, biotin operon repressor / biotin---[acetyl-CoA-carboxylase] ligase
MIQKRRYFKGERLFFDRLSSTNDRMLDMINSANPAEGTVIYTSFQTGGRGYMDNTWQSEEGKNLLFSILLLPDFLLSSKQFELSKVISLAMADIIKAHCKNITIKWPNDIYAGRKKIAGILIENVVTGNRIERCIAGIGLNVNQEHFTSDLPNPTSLVLETGCQFDMTELLDRLTGRIEFWYNVLYRDELETIDREYLHYLYGMNEFMEFISNDRKFIAKVAGIEETGELILEMGNGRKIKFGFKEVIYT